MALMIIKTFKKVKPLLSISATYHWFKVISQSIFMTINDICYELQVYLMMAIYLFSHYRCTNIVLIQRLLFTLKQPIPQT